MGVTMIQGCSLYRSSTSAVKAFALSVGAIPGSSTSLFQDCLCLPASLSRLRDGRGGMEKVLGLTGLRGSE